MRVPVWLGPWLVASAALASLSCSSEAGRFELALNWPECSTLDPQARFFVFAQIESLATAGDARGRIVGAADPTGPVACDQQFSLRFDDIPNDDRLIVVVELRQTANPTSLLQLFGISRPFALSPGEVTSVEVDLGLIPPPQTDGLGQPVLTVVPTGVTPGAEGIVRVNTSTVTVILTTDTGVSATVSNISTFEEAATRNLALAAAAATTEGCPDPASRRVCSYRFEWNLNAGVSTPCRPGQVCLRQVFVRFQNDRSFESAVATRDVFIDLQPPGLDRAFLELEPNANAVQSVRLTDGAAGSVWQIRVRMDEDLLEPPILTAGEAGRIPFTNTSGAFFVYRYPVDETLGPSGRVELPVRLEATDLAGNISQGILQFSSELTTFAIDNLVPAAPDVDAGDRIVYRRFPWGTPDRGSAPEFRLLGRPGAAEPGTVVLVSRPDLGRVTEIPVEADGGFGGPDGALLPMTDAPAIRVQTTDLAGNLSPPVTVRNVEWTATFGNAEENGTLANPHRLGIIRAAADSLDQNPGPRGSAPTQAQLNAVAALDDAQVEVRSAAAWRRTGTIPTGRARFGMAYDSARDRVVVFGGRWDTGVGFQLFDSVTEQSRLGWLPVLSDTTGPQTRYGLAMVYDPVRGRSVVFGGCTGGNLPTDETWEWDGRSWSQRQANPRPPAVGDPGAAFDVERGRMVVFGGSTTGCFSGTPSVVDDTWVWTGTTWILANPADRPPGRRLPAMVYDEAQRRILMHGGETESGVLGDLWQFDGSTWSPVATSAPRPSARAGHAMAYNPDSGEVVLFGGESSGGNGLNDTWVLEGTTWSQRSPPTRPSARYQHRMLYARQRKQIVLFGGVEGFVNRSDSWAWTGTTWINTTPNNPDDPPPDVRRNHAMAYNAATNETLLYAGAIGNFPVFLGGDTWLFNGYRWRLVQNPSPPGGRNNAAMAYDTARARSVLFGSATSTYEHSGSSWILRFPVTFPPAYASPAMTYDVARGVAVLFGGRVPGDPPSDRTWEWNGVNATGWRARALARSPSARFDAAVAFDVARGRSVLFGGNDATKTLDDTWEWDGTTWREVAANGPRPPARQGHTMVYDPTRERVVMFGGQTGIDGFRDTWEWNGASWRDITLDGEAPEARFDHAMAFETQFDRSILFGGGLAGNADNETWMLPGSVRPGVLVAFSWPAAEAPDDGIQSIAVTAGAGGDSSAPGVRLLGWTTRPGRWQTLATNQDAGNAPGGLTYTTSNDVEPSHLLFSRDRQIFLLLSTNGIDRGSTTARLTLDYIGATVSYRLDSP